MKKNDCTHRGLLGLLLALCMTLLLLTTALAGVTDVTGGSHTTVKTTVVNEYTDIHEEKTFDLTGKSTTFTDAKKYFGGTSGTLAVGFPDLGVVNITYTVSADTVVMTVTNYDDLPDGTYTCPEQEDKSMMTTIYTGSKLVYNSTTYEGGNILVGDPDALFNAYTGIGKIIINETRHDYYTRNHIWRGYILTVTGNGNGNGNGNSSGTGNGNTTGTGSGGTSGTGLSGATGGYNSPKTFDAGLAVYAASTALSGAGLIVLRRRKR